MGLLIRLAINAVAIWAAVAFVDGLTFDGDWPSLVVITIAMAFVNAVIKPLATLLSIPLVILTLGLFIVVINALMLSVVLWVSDVFDLGLVSVDFGSTLAAAIVISIVSWILTAVFRGDDD